MVCCWPVWEFAGRVQITQSVLEGTVDFPWFSRPRLADRCAILSFRSPYAPAVAANLRRRGRSLVNAAFDQQSPGHARQLVGQGHSDQHLRLACQHLRQP
jgi:hypothetical protein